MNRAKLTLFFFATIFLWGCTESPFSPQLAGYAAEWEQFASGARGYIAYFAGPHVCVMNLTEKTVDTIHTLETFAWEMCVAWSPNGLRLAVQTPWELIVMNHDGNDVRPVYDIQGQFPVGTVSSGWLNDTLLAFSTGPRILIAAINADDSVDNIAVAVDDPPYESYGRVEGMWPYLSYIEARANVPTGGYHRPVMLNLETGERNELVARDQDGCGLAICNAAGGMAIFNYNRHTNPALLTTGRGQILDSLIGVEGEGTGAFQWSNKREFIIHNGYEKTDASAWIRNISDMSWYFAGDNVYRPDLWIGDLLQITRTPSPRILPEDHVIMDSVLVTIDCADPLAEIRFTLDGGVSYQSIFDRVVVHAGDTADTQWTIPMDEQFVSHAAIIRIQDYDNRSIGAQSDAFIIAE